MDPAGRERVSEFMRSMQVGDAWLDALDPEAPQWLRSYVVRLIEAYRTGDVDFLLDNADPEIEIVQPRELPDARTYRGREGVIEALLDWPLEWENFSVAPHRIFSPDDSRVVIDAIHSGRSLKMGIEIKARIVWLLEFNGQLMRRWDMYSSVEAALGLD